jgi:uncharacterized membrane protein YkvA (DUF1232 family)
MSEKKSDLTLGLLIKSLLEKHSLSMRKLSTLTGIDTATISRIVNGKQQAKLNHLKQFACHFNIPIEKLIEAAGFEVGRHREDNHLDIHYSVDTIQEVLGNLFDQQFTTARVEQELDKYEQYAQTKEGHQIIYRDFKTKVEQVSGAGPFIEQLKHMHTEYCNDTTTTAKRVVLGSALLYFILSADIIPDYVFPIGYLDDAMAVQIVLNRLSKINNTG